VSIKKPGLNTPKGNTGAWGGGREKKHWSLVEEERMEKDTEKDI